MTTESDPILVALGTGTRALRLAAARRLRRQLRLSPQTSFPVAGLALMAALSAERDEDVQAALLRALAEAGYGPAVTLLLSYASSPSAAIRLAATEALARCVGKGRRVIPALLRLSRDPSPRVRDWACAGLELAIEVYERRDSDILEALAERLDDTDDAARDEAILGLAVAQDRRGAIALKNELDSGRRTFQLALAARALGDEATAQRVLSEA